MGIRTIQIKIVQTDWTVRTSNSSKSSYRANSANTPSKQSKQFFGGPWSLGIHDPYSDVGWNCLQYEVHYRYYNIAEIDSQVVSISILWYRLSTLETSWCDRSAITYVTTQSLVPWSNNSMSNLFKKGKHCYEMNM